MAESLTTDQAKPCIIVSGLGRCGSSLVMQMLHAGGIPCVGEAPAFEPPESSPVNFSAAWMHEQRGRAFKLLDPQISSVKFDGAPAIVILLERNVDQQAASMAKFGRLMMGLPDDRSSRRRLAKSFSIDQPRAAAKFARLPTKVIPFESIIDDPAAAAAELSAYLAIYGHALNPEHAVTVVRQRSPDCYPGLLEVDLVAEYGT